MYLDKPGPNLQFGIEGLALSGPSPILSPSIRQTDMTIEEKEAFLKKNKHNDKTLRYKCSWLPFPFCSSVNAADLHSEKFPTA